MPHIRWGRNDLLPRRPDSPPCAFAPEFVDCYFNLYSRGFTRCEAAGRLRSAAALSAKASCRVAAI